MEMPNKADSENDIILEGKKSFHSATTVVNVIMIMKIMRKLSLNKLRHNTRRHLKVRKAMRMTRLNVNK
jgi:hypothetical protein